MKKLKNINDIFGNNLFFKERFFLYKINENLELESRDESLEENALKYINENFLVEVLSATSKIKELYPEFPDSALQLLEEGIPNLQSVKEFTPEYIRYFNHLLSNQFQSFGLISFNIEDLESNPNLSNEEHEKLINLRQASVIAKKIIKELKTIKAYVGENITYRGNNMNEIPLLSEYLERINLKEKTFALKEFVDTEIKAKTIPILEELLNHPTEEYERYKVIILKLIARAQLLFGEKVNQEGGILLLKEALQQLPQNYTNLYNPELLIQDYEQSLQSEKPEKFEIILELLESIDPDEIKIPQRLNISYQPQKDAPIREVKEVFLNQVNNTADKIYHHLDTSITTITLAIGRLIKNGRNELKSIHADLIELIENFKQLKRFDCLYQQKRENILCGKEDIKSLPFPNEKCDSCKPEESIQIIVGLFKEKAKAAIELWPPASINNRIKEIRRLLSHIDNREEKVTKEGRELANELNAILIENIYTRIEQIQIPSDEKLILTAQENDIIGILKEAGAAEVVFILETKKSRKLINKLRDIATKMDEDELGKNQVVNIAPLADTLEREMPEVNIN